MIFNATIETAAPLHIASPGDYSISVDTLNIRQGSPDRQGSPGMFPITRTQHMPILDQTGESRPLPVIPANVLRGRLRRLAAGIVFQSLKEREQTVSLETYHGMTCGAVTGSPQGILTLNDVHTAALNPFMAIFGGGPKMLRSSLVVSTAYPHTKTTADKGLVPAEDNAALPEREWQLTQPVFFRRVDDALSFADLKAQEFITNYSESLIDWMQSVGLYKDTKKREKDAKSRKSVTEKAAEATPIEEGEKGGARALQGFHAFEIVIPGVRFSFAVSVDENRVPLASIGLMLHTFAKFITQQGIGGWTRNGFGRFRSRILGTIGETTHPTLFLATSGVYEPNDSIPEVAAALDAWAMAASTMEAADLEAFFTLKAPTAASK